MISAKVFAIKIGGSNINNGEHVEFPVSDV